MNLAYPFSLISGKGLGVSYSSLTQIGASKVESTPKGSGSVFIVGPRGAMHSEPYMTTTRFYMSLLPGSEKQIQEFDRREKMVDEMRQAGKNSDEIDVAVNKYIESCMKDFKGNFKK